MTYSKAREAGVVAGLYIGSVAVALIMSAALVAVTGGSWREVFAALLDGSLRAPGRWGDTLGVAVPLIFVGVGTVIGGRAGLINIGQEGQLTFGAAVAMYAGLNLFGPGPFALVAMLLIGLAAGAFWAGIAGVLLYWRRVPEVLTTLLLVTVAAQVVGFGLQRPWILLAPIEGRSSRNIVSEQLDPSRRIGRMELFGNEFPISVFFALAFVIVVAVVLGRTDLGIQAPDAGPQSPAPHSEPACPSGATAWPGCCCRAASPAWPGRSWWPAATSATTGWFPASR